MYKGGHYHGCGEKLRQWLKPKENKMIDVSTPAKLLAYMRETTSTADWNLRCDKVKAANGGYPPFWFETMILSGEADEILGKFGADTKLRVYTIK